MQENTCMQPQLTDSGAGGDVFRLHCNENQYGMSPGVQQSIREELQRLHFYPDPECLALRERLAEYHQVSPDMILVGNGTDEILLLSALAFLGSGKIGLMTEATYPNYRAVTTLSGAHARQIPMRNYHIPIDELIEACQDGVHAVFVCNPHNPTGTILKREDIVSLLNISLIKDFIPIIDEAYADFADPPFVSSIPLVRAGERAIVTRTFSKSYGLAGFRVGYAIGPGELIAQIYRVRSALPFSVNRLAQVAALAALSDREFIARTRQSIKRAKEFFYQKMEQLHIPYVPSHANFVLIKVPGNGEEWMRSLRNEYSIFVRNTSLFGYENHIRISMGRQDQMEYLCAAIEKIAQEQDGISANKIQ